MTTTKVLSIASDEEIEKMLTELANPDGQYETRDYGPIAMDSIALERGFESFLMRVEKTGWMEMGHQYSFKGQYSLK